MKKVICFDLEGPLSPMDHAYEVMKLIPGGEKVFEVISRYDDLLTIEGRKNYEPGDTLKLIVPFLIEGRVTEASLKKISDRAALVNGAKKLIAELQKNGWQAGRRQKPKLGKSLSFITLISTGFWIKAKEKKKKFLKFIRGLEI